MTCRVPLDDEQECGFRRTGARAEMKTASGRVLIGHVDAAIGAFLALLVALKKISGESYRLKDKRKAGQTGTRASTKVAA